MLALCSFTAGAENVRGDVDLDGRVNIADVTALIDYLLTSDVTGISLVNADCDHDGRVNIADVTALIDYLLTGLWGDGPDEHECVDLGLPSGTLWATCNVGANNPEEYGDYFAWGETEPKDEYGWNNYKWGYYDSSGNAMLIKYNGTSNYGTVNNKTELDPEDDAAYVNWGPSWSIPSLEQYEELVAQCTWTWTQQNGVNGRLVTGPNGNSLFLPAAGYCVDNSIYEAGSSSYYWSCMILGNYDSRSAAFQYFEKYRVFNNIFVELNRSNGYTIRAVRAS